MLTTIIVFILVLSVLVFVHEFGHFFTARRLGVKAEEFGFGFPPRAIGLYRNTQKKWRLVKGTKSAEELSQATDENLRPDPQATIYSLNWLPLGGFVKIKGQDGEDKEASDSFASKKIWQRVIILSAGVIMNVILAWGLFSVGYLLGLPQETSQASSGAIISESAVLVYSVLPNSPAEAAGLEPGDVITAVGAEAVLGEQSLPELINATQGEEVVLTVERGETNLSIPIAASVDDQGRATIGISIFSTGLVRYPFWQAIGEGAKTTGLMLKEIVVAFGSLIGQLVTGQSVSGQLAGPVGIANITGDAARLGIVYLLQLTALLSLNLAIINIIPFPALDGGRILFLIIEKLRGRPVKQETEAIIHNLGFMLLMVLILLVTYKDIVRLF